MLKKLEKLLFFTRKKHPELCYFQISTALFAYRLFFLFQYFSFISFLILAALLGQAILMIFIENIKKLICKRFFCFNIASMSVHFISIYLIPPGHFDFFLGIEITVIIHLNFKLIRNRILRYVSLSFLMFFSLRKYNIIQTEFFNIIYFIFILLIFENLTQKNLLQNISKRNSEIFDAASLSNISLKKNSKASSTIKLQSYFGKPISSQNTFANKNIALNIMDFINEGILVITPDFEIIYANNCLFNLLATKKLEEIKQILFRMEEHKDINLDEFEKIPDFSVQNIIRKTIHIIDSFDSSEKYENSDFEIKKNILNEEFSSKKINTNMTISQEEFGLQYKKWSKRRISDNLSENLFGMFNKPHPKNFLNYLTQIFNHFKNKDEILTNDNQTQSDINCSMYGSLVMPDNSEASFFVNSIPFGKDDSLNNMVSSNNEIIITIRKLSEVEIKYKRDNSSKNKMFGSFCHELRTPINSIINMIDLMQSHMDEGKVFNQDSDEILNELLASAVISSHLLLSQIDDFIDYFAYSNEILELNVGPFDIHAFFNEISSMFSYVAIKKKLGFFIDIDDSIPTIVHNDHQKLRQILYNLLNNSIRYTESGYIKILVKLKKKSYIEVNVIDTGMGIKKFELDSLGRISSNNKDAGKTTCGLGLYISNILCHLIKNTSSSPTKKGLIVYSEYGKGTCFQFCFKKDIRVEQIEAIENQKISTCSITRDKIEHKHFSDFSSIGSREKKTIVLPSNEHHRPSLLEEVDKSRKPRNVSAKNNLKLVTPNSSIDAIISTRSIYTKKQNLERNAANAGKAKFFNISSSFGSDTDNSISKLENLICECPKVMIVDDGPFNVDVCQKLLLKWKIISETANNGLDAVMKVKKILNNLNEQKFCYECKFFKLILMDVDMPVKNGIEATKEILNLIKNQGFKVDIVGLSAFTQEEIKQRGREAGMSEYILKPINSNIMKNLIVKYILEGSS